MRSSLLRRCAVAPAFCAALMAASAARANHGPGASGGGTNTQSGETLPPGKLALSLREDYSQFEHFTAQAAAGRAALGGDFDALDHGFLTAAGVDYGIAEDVQVGLSIGFFHGRN